MYRQQSERSALAVKVLELPQTMAHTWMAADIAMNRLLLEMICFNSTFKGVKIIAQMRKPFGILVEGLLVVLSRGDRRWTIPIDNGHDLLMQAFSQRFEFSADEFSSFGHA